MTGMSGVTLAHHISFVSMVTYILLIEAVIGAEHPWKVSQKSLNNFYF